MALKKKWVLLLLIYCQGWDKTQNLTCLNISQHHCNSSENLKYVQPSVIPIIIPSLIKLRK